MLGRGLIANPALARQISGGSPYTIEQFAAFHDEIYEGYKRILSGDKNVLFKMKELWFYMLRVFPAGEDYAKKLKKVSTCKEYEALMKSMWTLSV